MAPSQFSRKNARSSHGRNVPEFAVRLSVYEDWVGRADLHADARGEG